MSLFAASFFLFFLRPVARSASETQKFEVKSGEGFRSIVNQLGEKKLIRAPRVAKFYLLLTGHAQKLKPGAYELDARMSSRRILSILATGPDRDVRITIFEGSSIYEIDALLAENNVFQKGDLVRYAKAQKESIEGKLFPDTYHFYYGSGAAEVVRKMTANFNDKALALLSSKGDFKQNLILASLLEKEIPDHDERRVAAGVLAKRVRVGMPLQVDATICYIKKIRSDGKEKCHPLIDADFDLTSRYNTYEYPGWPTGPISNPGLSAIKAALDPEPSDYWFYLSDPVTKKTIFSETLDTHRANRVKYLLNS